MLEAAVTLQGDEIEQSLQRLSTASDERLGQAIGAAAVIALIPGADQVRREDVKLLIERLCRGLPVGVMSGDVRERAEHMADMILDCARNQYRRPERPPLI